MLIFWQCVGQTMVDFHWAYAGLYFVSNDKLEDSLACRFHGLASLYCYFLTWNYTLALSWEIFSKVRNPLRHSYRHKSWIYHSASHLSCIALTAAVGSTGASGVAVDNTCFIRDGSWAESLMVLLVLPALSGFSDRCNSPNAPFTRSPQHAHNPLHVVRPGLLSTLHAFLSRPPAPPSLH